MGQIIKSVFFVSVCMYVSVGTLTVAFFLKKLDIGSFESWAPQV